MYTLDYKDYNDVLALINNCVLCLRNGGNKEEILSAMLQSFSADQAVFLSAGNKRIDLSNSYALGAGRSYLNQYVDYFWRYDPLYERQFYTDQNSLVFKTDDVIPYSKMVKLEYYNSFLRPQKLLGELIIRLYSNDIFLGVISLQRFKNHRFFDSKDIRKATLVVPHLINIFETADKLGKANEKITLLEEWMESYTEGIILIDAQRKPLFLNSKANLFCTSIFGQNEKFARLTNTENTLPELLIQDCEELERMQTSGISPSSHINRIINTGDQRIYFAQYFLVFSPSPETKSYRFVVFLSEVSKSSDLTRASSVLEHNLSKREEDIAQYVAMGLSNKQIADKLNISPFTVQNHLKNIFGKTGLDSRTKLANLIRFTNTPQF
jgi:DNA-binding CsgD family transcriptional regulator